jgi:hypothetical protein
LGARRLPTSHPHLEVQVRSGRIARLPGLAQRLPADHRLTGADNERARLAWANMKSKPIAVSSTT